MSRDSDALFDSISVHFAALVSALDRNSPGLADRFTKHLEDTRNQARHKGSDNEKILDCIATTITLIKGE